jgi:TolA-binding protein
MQIRLLLCIAAIILCFPVQGQINLNFENPDAEFLKARNAYEKELYNKAIRGFERYIKSSLEEPDYVEEATYYIVVSKLRLRHSSAVEFANQFINEHPQSQLVMFVHKELGDFYFASGRFKQAGTHYRKVSLSILSSEEVDDFRFKKGYALFKAGKYEDSKEAFYPLTLKPSEHYIKATYYYGYVCYMMQDYANALRAFLKIEDTGPQTMQLYICQMYYLKGDYQQAIDYANKVNLGKLDNEKNIVKAKSYYRLHDYANAAKYFSESLVDYNDLKEEELYEIGYSYYKIQDCSKAFVAFTRIANKGTALAQIASYHMGECFLKKDKKQNAYNAFFEAQRTDFDKEIKKNALLNYAKLAFELSNHEVAIKSFNKLIDLYPQTEQAQESKKYIAAIFLATNDYKSAIPILEGLGDLDGETRTIYQRILLYRGEELYLNQDFGQSKGMFEKASKMKDVRAITAQAEFWLGEIAYRSKQYAAARKHFQNFLSYDVASSVDYLYPYASYSLGYTFFMEKNYSEAITHYQRFKTLTRQKSGSIEIQDDATLRIADCHFILGNYNAAQDGYLYVSAKKAAGSDYALYQQGMILGIQNRSQQKINVLKRISTEYPNSIYIPDAVFEIATEWMQRQNFQEAERNFRYLIEDYPSSLFVKKCYLSLGLLYYNMEKDEQALVEFKTVVKNYPGTREAKEAIGFIERIYVSMGKSDEYLKWLETVPNTQISISFRDSVSYQSAFNLYLKSEFPGAINNFNNYLKEFPKGYFIIPAQFYLATSLNKTGAMASARYYYRSLVNAGGNEFREESSKVLAQNYYNNERLDSALYYYARLESFSTDKQNLQMAYLGQIRCAYELNDKETVEKKAVRFLMMDNLTLNVRGEVQNKVGLMNYKQGILGMAKEYFGKTLESNKDRWGAEAYYYSAQILFETDSIAKAKAMALDFNNHFSGHEKWQAHCFILLAEVYKHEGDYFQAKATLNFVLDTYSDPGVQAKAKAVMATLE